MYDIRIVCILTANDDGSQAATPSATAIADSVDQANKVYNPHGINFTFDPATDIYRFNDDKLNRDSRRRDHAVYTNPDVKPDSSGDPAFEVDVMNTRRNEVALRFPGRATIYFTMGSQYVWSESEKRWIYGKRGSSWSNGTDEFVSMAAHGAGGDLMAHELGHFLHLDHVFAWAGRTPPATIADAAARIKKFVENDGGSKDTALNLFEGDGLLDTPPDAGPQLFKNQCDPAESSVSIPVSFSDGSSRTYTLAPDRENIMNYWNKTCRGGVGRISAEQSARVHNALRNGNRRHLVVPVVLYFGSFGTGDRSQTRAIGWSMNDFAKRFNDELAADRHSVHMQAYDIGGGQIRWDGVWESGGNRGQTRAIGWSMNDFAKRFNDELAADRHSVHMQAYDIGGGQIRWDGVWESGGNRGQTRAIGWSFNDFIRRWDQETSNGKRLVHMQIYDLGAGNLRFDGIWETASGPQKRVVGLPMMPFADHFDELTSSGWHVEQMSGVLRMYPEVANLVATATGSAAANRTVSFGSDVDGKRAALAPLAIPPLSERDAGCDLTSDLNPQPDPAGAMAEPPDEPKRAWNPQPDPPAA
jgi:hypothetical protein